MVAIPPASVSYTHLDVYKRQELSDDVMKDAIAYLDAEYKRRGLNPKNHPGMHKLLTDLDFQAEVIQKTKETYKATYQNYIAGVRY